jgi:hypothetical protein
MQKEIRFYRSVVSFCIILNHVIRLLLPKVWIVIFILAATPDVFAQNFSQVNQLPLQLNPSLAGGKIKKRISAGINKLGHEQYRERNIALGYDQLSKKLHAGIGLYYLNYRNDSSLIDNPFNHFLPEEIVEKKFYRHNSQHMIGACIAPKYNIYYKNIPKKIKYTFSPSVFIEAGKENSSTLFDVRLNTYYNYTFTYSTNSENYSFQWDSLHATYRIYKFANTFFRTGFGLQLNTGKLILLSKSTYSINAYQESIEDFFQSSSSTDKQKLSSETFSRNLSAIESNMHIGYTFSKHKKSDVTFTPILGIGIKHYLNLQPSSTSSDVYRNNLSNTSLTQINYAHASGNFRYKKLLLGACYTKYFSGIYQGITIGYQSDLIKLMITGGSHIKFKKTSYHNIEITTDIFF